jgi:hypothetical protein
MKPCPYWNLMIRDHKQINISASPEKVFSLIETMPNKFPVYEILETKLFIFLRILLVDGLQAAKKAVGIDRSNDVLVLDVGDSMGPFKLTERKRPLKYLFTLRSFFFDCRTGYSLSRKGDFTTLSFDLIADDPKLMAKAWWIIVKPIHRMLANKVLKVIKAEVEGR